MSFHTGGMKANSRMHAPLSRFLPLTALSSALVLAACVPQRPAPAPTPVSSPTARPTPTPKPVEPVRPIANWRDMPATPGDWNWSRPVTGSQAVFAGGLFWMHCNRENRTITLTRAASGTTAQAQMLISTTQGNRSLVANPVAGGLAASLDARDPLLDDMAFSRGRFAVQVAGSDPLFVPSWTEVSRVIEDCR